MSNSELLIVGIDPGTTAGAAFLSIEGELLKTFASRELKLDKIILKAIELGKPFIIGTDKAKIPDSVSKFASKFNARIISPKQDLLVSEKKALAKGIKFNTEHELDATASALFAFNKIKSLLDRIKKVLERRNKMQFMNEIIELVIKKEMSINSAIDYLLNPEDEETLILNEAIKNKNLSEKSFIKLFEKLALKKQEVSYLHRELSEIKQKNKALERLLDRKERRFHNPKSPEEKHYFNTMKNLIKTNQIERKRNSELISEVEEYKRIILKRDQFIIARKINNLGADFELKKARLNLDENCVLIVKNPNEFSERTIKELQRLQITLLICDEKPSKALQQKGIFTFIDKKRLALNEYTEFALADKKEIDKLIEEKDMIKEIVAEYKRERMA